MRISRAMHLILLLKVCFCNERAPSLVKICANSYRKVQVPKLD